MKINLNKRVKNIFLFGSVLILIVLMSLGLFCTKKNVAYTERSAGIERGDVLEDL